VRRRVKEKEQLRVLNPLTPHPSRLTDERWMRRALELAEQAEREGEVPIGAVLILNGELVAEGWNQPLSTNDPTAHAEIVTLRAAATHLGNYRLPGATLYVTLEPCVMCAGALVQARVARVVYGAPDPQRGAAGSVFKLLTAPALNHHAEITSGVLGDECSQILKAFFERKRAP
jgi:tRNA(adenine34) deaminase